MTFLEKLTKKAPEETSLRKKTKSSKKPQFKTELLTSLKLEEKKELPKQKEKKPILNLEEDSEGELSIDLYETNGDFVLQSTIAGVRAEDLDIVIENDMVTIRGSRQRPDKEKRNYLHQECYWGPFSRRIVLPADIDGSRIRASVKDGVLTLILPKIRKVKKKKVSISQED
jgi:HSP20 family protein